MFLTRLKICRKGSSKISKEPEIRESTRRLTRTGGSSESNVKQRNRPIGRKNESVLIDWYIRVLIYYNAYNSFSGRRIFSKKKKKRKENCVKNILLFSV
jgi:hypothetical protein